MCKIKISNHTTRPTWSRVMLLILLSITFAGTSVTFANSFKTGYSLYSRGDFAGAERALSAAAKTSKSTAERGNIFKFLGISQFMLGKKPSAQASFKTALVLVPNLNIKPDEVLDERVIAVFNAQKKGPAPRAAAPASKKKITRLFVSSNANGASILIDGILAGKTGVPLETAPGIVEIQVDAPGYLSKRAKVKITPNTDNNVTLNLDRPKPKAVAAAKAQVAPKPKKERFLPTAKVDSLFADGDDSVASGDPSLGARNLEQEFALDAASGGGTAAQPQPPYYAPPPPAYMAPAPYPQPMYAPPPPMYAYPTQPYAPMYGQPQPMYQQPYQQPMYQQPYAQPSSPYAPAPPPNYAAAPPPPLADPVQPAAPEPIPVPGYDTGSQNEDFLPPQRKSKKPSKIARNSPSRSYSSRSRAPTMSKRSRKTKSGSTLIAILPLGAGQFQNGDTLLGTAFAAAEIGSLYWTYYNYQEEQKARANAQTYFQSNASDAQKQEFSDSTNTYIKEKQQQQLFGEIGFFGLWGVGAIEAIVSMPSTSTKTTKKRRITLQEDDGTTQKYRLVTNDDLDFDQKVVDQAVVFGPRFDFGLLAVERNGIMMTPALRFHWKL